MTLVVGLVRVGLQDDGATTPNPAPAKVKAKGKAEPIRRTATRQPKRIYVVRAGDTLATIAVGTGIPVATLEQLNPQVEPTSLFIGDKIRLR